MLPDHHEHTSRRPSQVGGRHLAAWLLSVLGVGLLSFWGGVHHGGVAVLQTIDEVGATTEGSFTPREMRLQMALTAADPWDVSSNRPLVVVVVTGGSAIVAAAFLSIAYPGKSR